ncbi:hypothetical protein [Staphylococcus hyicus]|uniref:hypothetical protein n=1 Tax=Staphylococcus hyicus TaxID=1284 RepID=UPI0031335516
MFKKDKYKEFVGNLEEQVNFFNLTYTRYSVGLEKLVTGIGGENEVKYRLKFHFILPQSREGQFYILNKYLEIPYEIDISKVVVESLSFNLKEMEEDIANKEIDCKVIKHNDSIFTYPTLTAVTQDLYVVSGFETDYIVPTISLNNPNSIISDKEINEMIKKHKNHS